jgi:ubiquinone biosynthesis protein UbiJ
MLKSDVEVDGDMRVAEAFSAVLREVDVDWEALLSNLVGDFFARKAAQASEHTSSWFSDSANRLRNETAEYLTEESDLSPATQEIYQFIDQVDTLHQDVDRLDARIKLLQDVTSNSSNKEK